MTIAGVSIVAAPGGVTGGRNAGWRAGSRRAHATVECAATAVVDQSALTLHTDISGYAAWTTIDLGSTPICMNATAERFARLRHTRPFRRLLGAETNALFTQARVEIADLTGARVTVPI